MAEVRRSTEAVVHLRSNKIVGAKNTKATEIGCHAFLFMSAPPSPIPARPTVPADCCCPRLFKCPPVVCKLNTPPLIYIFKLNTPPPPLFTYSN